MWRDEHSRTTSKPHVDGRDDFIGDRCVPDVGHEGPFELGEPTFSGASAVKGANLNCGRELHAWLEAGRCSGRSKREVGMISSMGVVMGLIRRCSRHAGSHVARLIDPRG